MTFDVSLRNFFADTREIPPETATSWEEARPLLRTVIRPITFLLDGDARAN